jgi:hypothetical protein
MSAVTEALGHTDQLEFYKLAATIIPVLWPARLCDTTTRAASRSSGNERPERLLRRSTRLSRRFVTGNRGRRTQGLQDRARHSWPS